MIYKKDFGHLPETVQAQVIAFHRAMGQPVLEAPTVPAPERARLRAELVTEECFELLAALFGDWEPLTQYRNALRNFIALATPQPDLVAVADACADIDYVTEGTRLEFGLNGPPIADEVQRSNMAKRHPCPDCDTRGYVQGKVGPEHYDVDAVDCSTCSGSGFIIKRRPDGKILKPSDWTAPDIAGVLRKQSEDPTSHGLRGVLARLDKL